MLLLKEQQGGLGDGKSRVWVFAANTAFIKSVPPGLGTLPPTSILLTPLSPCIGPPQGCVPCVFLIPMTYEVPD